MMKIALACLFVVLIILASILSSCAPAAGVPTSPSQSSDLKTYEVLYLNGEKETLRDYTFCSAESANSTTPALVVQCYLPKGAFGGSYIFLAQSIKEIK